MDSGSDGMVCDATFLVFPEVFVYEFGNYLRVTNISYGSMTADVV
jgi:hypothetical protein